MYPWIILGLFLAGLYYLVDRLVRRKKWKNNTKQEKASLIISMVCLPVYAFFSALGALIGIVAGGSSPAAELLWMASVVVGGLFWMAALGITVASLVLRKRGKLRASCMIHVFGMGLVVLELALMLLSEAMP